MSWVATEVVVEVSPDTTTRPVLTSVSQATRPAGSSRSTASRTPSEIWSATLSGWPSVTDSDVKRYSLSESTGVFMSRGRVHVRFGTTHRAVWSAPAQGVERLGDGAVALGGAGEVDGLEHVGQERVGRDHEAEGLLAPAQRVRDF